MAGGTLDIWPLYLLHENAQTLNAAITIRAECRLTPNADGRLRILAEDTGARVEVTHWSELGDTRASRLVARILRFFRAEGLTVHTRSAAPVGAGLAGSSALNIALCAALARWQKRRLAGESLIDLALNLEAQVLGVPTGGQDYRPATYGGIAALEMGPAGVTRVPLNIDPRILASRTVLVYTEQSRDSGINNWEVTKRRIDGDPAVTALLDEIRDVTLGMRKGPRDLELGRSRAPRGARMGHSEAPGPGRHDTAARCADRVRPAGGCRRGQGLRRRRRRLPALPGATRSRGTR